MKISKDKLKQIVREELESLTVLSERKIKGKAVGNFLKKGRAGRTLTMQGKKYTDLGKGKWKGPDNKKLDWIELSSMASALGDEMVTLDEQKISENKNKFFIVDPTGMRGEPAYYRRKSTNDDSAFEFSTLFGATGFDDKGSANTTMKRVKSSSQKYRRATLKVLRGDELHEEIDENRALDNAIANRDANRAKNKSEFKEFQSLYFDMNNAIQKVSKNNKLKGYAGEVTHAVCDLLYFVEQDRLAIGEVFNALKRLRKKARDH